MTCTPDLAVTDDIATRLAALTHHTLNGPDYSRDVAEPYRDAVRMLSEERLHEAEYWTRMAEMRAGVITFEQWYAEMYPERGLPG